MPSATLLLVVFIGHVHGLSTGLSTSLASVQNGLTTTVNATCGGTLTCIGSVFGDCCSQHNFCGSTDAYCGAGCLPAFGTCNSTTVVTPTPTPEPQISIAAIAGIATGISVAVIALFIASWFFFCRCLSGRRQRQEILGGVSGNYLGDGSSAVYLNGGDGAAVGMQQPYAMRETGINGSMLIYSHGVVKSINADAGRAGPDSIGLGYQTQTTTQRAEIPSTESASMPILANTPTASVQPPLLGPTSPQNQQEGQEVGISEMEGGEKMLDHRQTPPAELEGRLPIQ